MSLSAAVWDPIVGDAILARFYGDKLVPLTPDDADQVRRHFS